MNIYNKPNNSHSYASIVIASILALGIGLTGSLIASAQTTPETTMPPLFNSAGVEVNTGNATPLAAGYYFLAPGAQANTEVYYYGDGTFVNETTGLYGGSVSDPMGTAGVTLVYGTREGTVVPGAPNTGAGGNAFTAWMTLIVTGILTVSGVAYLVTHKGGASADDVTAGNTTATTLQ